MILYVIKLLILLPIMGGLIWGSLKLAQKMQIKLGAAPQGGKAAKIVGLFKSMEDAKDAAVKPATAAVTR